MNKKIITTLVLRSWALSLVLIVCTLVTVLSVLLPAHRTEAATSSTLNFQARLMSSSGAIVPDGFYNVEFKLYNASSSSGSSQGSCTGDSNCLWTETRTSGNTVRVMNGYLTVNLGSVTSLPAISWDQELWLTMNIGGTSGSPVWDGEMSPRLKLTAVPYAFRAGQLATMNGSFTSTLSFVQPTANRTIQAPNESGTICLQGSSNCGFVTGTVNDFIQNQNSSDQTANFRISGTGQANTALLAPLFDTASAGTLSIGTTSATGINLDKSTTITGGLTQSGGVVSLTGNGASTFSTTSGGITIQAFNTNVLTLNTSGAGTVSLGNTNSTTISIGRGSDIARTINIGNAGSSTTQTISIGSLNGGSNTTIQGGTGASAIALTAGSGGTITLSTSGSGTVSVQGGTSGVNIASNGTANTVQIGNTTGAVSQTINIGNNATASSTSNINIGSSVAGTTAILGPTTITNRTSGSTDTVVVSNSTSTGAIIKLNDNSTTVMSILDGGDALFKGADSASAFQVQATTSSLPHFTVDTSAKKVTIGSASTDANVVLFILDSYNTTDPTGVGGAMYFNTTRNTMRCFEAENWTDCIRSSRAGYYYANELFNVNDTANANDVIFFGGGGGTATQQAGVAGHPGIIRLGNVVNNDNFATISLDGPDNGILFSTGDTWNFEATVRIPTLSTGTETFSVRIGFIDKSDTEAVDGCYMRYTNGTNGGRWQGACRSNNTESTCDTGTAPTANAWDRISVRVIGSGKAEFRVDGASTAACVTTGITTNIPSATGRETGYGVNIEKTINGVARTLDVDYIEAIGELTPR